MRKNKKWDDMTPNERLHSWELFAIELEGAIERRKKREKEIEEKEVKGDKGNPTGS